MTLLQDVPQSCCFSNDGKLLMIGMQDGRWKVVDVETKMILDECFDLNDSVHAIQISPNGSILAIATKSGIIHLYQVSNEGKKYNRIGRCIVSRDCAEKNESDNYIIFVAQEDAKKLRSSSTGSPVNFVVSC